MEWFQTQVSLEVGVLADAPQSFYQLGFESEVVSLRINNFVLYHKTNFNKKQNFKN